MSQEFTSLVNKATTPGPMEDWDTILQISEILSHRPDESSPAVMAAINQRLQSTNLEVQLLALTLLDSCIKNAPPFFVKIVVQPQNMNIINTLARSNHAQIRERVGGLLQEWRPEFQKVQTTSPSSPVIAPQRSPAPAPVPVQQPRRTREEKLEKLRQDLVVVHETVELLLQLVDTATTSQDLRQQHVQQVVYNCDEMHRRLVALIEKVPEEELLLQLIESNEELCAAIDYYEEFKKSGNKNQALLKPMAKPQQTQPQQQQPIDLDDIFPVTNNTSNQPYNALSPVSLEDLLNRPSRPVGDSMAREFQQIETTQSSGGFGALAKRHNTVSPSAPLVHDFVTNNTYNPPPVQQQQVYPSVNQQLSPNPFDEIDLGTQEAPQETSGFAAIAKRKNPTQEFGQFLESHSKPEDDPFA